MSKNRKQRESPAGAPSSAPPPDGGIRSSGGVFSRRVILQLLAIVGLSCVLGFTFNAASPVGVRFGEPATPAPVAASVAVKTTLPATPIPAAPVLTNPVVASASKSTNVVVAASMPSPPVAKPVAAPTPWSVSHSPAVTNPVAVATPPPAQPNPTPIHWPEAKTLVAENRAVLVDVRHKGIYDAGHIPGATSLPESSSPEEFKTFLSNQPANLTVIVYCSSTTCSQSLRVASRLVNEFRWPAVRYMTGGYAEYQQAELANPAAPPTP